MEMEPGMLSLVGNIFIWGVKFNVVHNKPAHENILKKLKKLFFFLVNISESKFLKKKWRLRKV